MKETAIISPAKLISLRDRSLANQVAAYINAHAYDNAEQLRLPLLSRQFGAGCKTLNMVFKRKYATSIHSYILTVRHKMICERLCAGVGIKEIAIETGYTELSNFSRDFAKMAGMSPRRYIEQLKPRFGSGEISLMLMLRSSSLERK